MGFGGGGHPPKNGLEEGGGGHVKYYLYWRGSWEKISCLGGGGGGSCNLLMTLQKIPPAPNLVKNERSLISQTQKCAKKVSPWSFQFSSLCMFLEVH